MKHNRRQFMQTLAMSFGAIAIAPIVKIQRAFGAHVALGTPLVTALKYTDDAKKNSPPERKDKKAFCNGCTYYQGDAKAKTAPCTIMSNAEVNAEGWCSSWQKKETKKA